MFETGAQVATDTISATNGQHTFRIRPDDSAVLGDSFQLRVSLNGLEILRGGQVAWGMYLPFLARRVNPY
jgi:hypothetical protein